VRWGGGLLVSGRCWGLAALIAAGVGLTACSKTSINDTAIAIVGQSAITRATLSHWMIVLAPQHVVPDPPKYTACVASKKTRGAQTAEPKLVEVCRQQYHALEQRALAYLIASRWLIGEATDQGTPVSDPEIQRRLREKEMSFPNGPAEFHDFLKAVAHTTSDVKLEVEDELAASQLRQRLLRDEPEVTPAQISQYYTQHMRRFKHREQRQFYIVENLTKVAAMRFREEFAQGKKSIAKPGNSLLERLPRPSNMRDARTIVKAIFAARPHVVSAPIRVERFYFLIEVIHVVPANVQRLAQVRDAIKRTLASEQRRRTLARFIEAWRRKWTARTDCRHDYVVQKCRQYGGARAREEALRFT
jgi:foldase protein PrsA